MGTTSLIFGIMAIGIAIGFALSAVMFISVFSLVVGFLISLGIAITAGGIGAAFLIQKYDADKKKSENS